MSSWATSSLAKFKMIYRRVITKERSLPDVQHKVIRPPSQEDTEATGNSQAWLDHELHGADWFREKWRKCKICHSKTRVSWEECLTKLTRFALLTISPHCDKPWFFELLDCHLAESTFWIATLQTFDFLDRYLAELTFWIATLYSHITMNMAATSMYMPTAVQHRTRLTQTKHGICGAIQERLSGER